MALRAASDAQPIVTLISFEHLRHSEQWRHWHELSASAPPFLAPEFFSLNRALAERGVLLVAEALQGGELVGALPLCLADHTLQAFRTDQTPGFDYCGSPEGLTAIWGSLLKDRRWAVLSLKNVPAQSVLATLLPQLAHASGCFTVVRTGARQPFFALSGFERSVSKKFLTNLRRCARKAGGIELERIATPSRTDLAEAVAIEGMGWKASAGTNIGADPRACHLYGAMLRYFGTRGQASLCFLRANGERVATLLSLEDGRTLYALKVGYDPRHANVSPGHLIVWQVALDAERRGLEEFNFVGQEDDWKRRWTAQVHEQVSVVIYRRSVRGLISCSLHQKLKPHLPEQLRDLHGVLRRGCQRRDVIGVHPLVERARGRIEHGLGITSGVARLIWPHPEPSERLGAPARFAPGSWVLDADRIRLRYARVREVEEIREQLDLYGRHDGLTFMPEMATYAKRRFPIASQLSEVFEYDRWVKTRKPVYILAGLACTGNALGAKGPCDRACALLWHEDWLVIEPHEGG